MSLYPSIYTGNILILRGDIEILPPDRETVSYEFLSQLVAEYLVKASPDTDISAALSKMPMTQSTSFLCHYHLDVLREQACSEVSILDGVQSIALSAGFGPNCSSDMAHQNSITFRHELAM